MPRLVRKAQLEPQHPRGFNLTTDTARWELAYHPFGHVGLRRRLYDKIDLAKRGKPLRVVVLGGSMTAGHGCPWKEDPGEPWPKVMETLLKMSLPTLTVANLASPGTTSTFPLANADDVMKAKPDVVIVDYAINDVIGDTSDLSPTSILASNLGNIQNTTARLLHMLLALPEKPAVVYLETFTHRSLFGYTCKHNVAEFPHWPVLQNFGIPIVSFTDAACNGPDTDMMSVWESMTGDALSPHVKCWVHLNVAHVMAGFFEAVSREASERSDAERGPDHSPEAVRQDPWGECALRPLTKNVAFKLDRRIKEEFFPAEAELVQPSFLVSTMPTATGSSDVSANRSTTERVWYFGEDRPGKPGWLAREGRAGTVTFNVTTAAGPYAAVLLEYLTSYENMGRATCWLDGDNDRGVSLNALRAARVSLTDTGVVAFIEGSKPGLHKLHCKSDGRKFKIVSLRSC